MNTLTLPDGLLWEDELWSPVAQNTDYMLSGSLLVQTGVKLAGRPITLSGDAHRAWISRTALLNLLALTEIPQQLTLNYHDRQFQVRFRFDEGVAVSADPILVCVPPQGTDWYHNLKIRLMECNEEATNDGTAISV